MVGGKMDVLKQIAHLEALMEKAKADGKVGMVLYYRGLLEGFQYPKDSGGGVQGCRLEVGSSPHVLLSVKLYTKQL